MWGRPVSMATERIKLSRKENRRKAPGKARDLPEVIGPAPSGDPPRPSAETQNPSQQQQTPPTPQTAMGPTPADAPQQWTPGRRRHSLSGPSPESPVAAAVRIRGAASASDFRATAVLEEINRALVARGEPPLCADEVMVLERRNMPHVDDTETGAAENVLCPVCGRGGLNASKAETAVRRCAELEAEVDRLQVMCVTLSAEVQTKQAIIDSFPKPDACATSRMQTVAKGYGDLRRQFDEQIEKTRIAAVRIGEMNATERYEQKLSQPRYLRMHPAASSASVTSPSASFAQLPMSPETQPTTPPPSAAMALQPTEAPAPERNGVIAKLHRRIVTLESQLVLGEVLASRKASTANLITLQQEQEQEQDQQQEKEQEQQQQQPKDEAVPPPIPQEPAPPVPGQSAVPAVTTSPSVIDPSQDQP